MPEGRLVTPTRMRSAIGRRMQESKQQAPHFYVSVDVEVDRIRSLLDDLNAAGETRVTFTAALAYASVSALKAHPEFNSVWTSDGLVEVAEINLGIAISVEGGLLAPALLSAQGYELPEIASALGDVVARTRSGHLKPNELNSGTFTLSNLGMFGVSAFTGIINPPQVGLLAAAQPATRLILRDGVPTEVSVMTATLSADHRAVDGVNSARFLETFKATLEESLIDAQTVTPGRGRDDR